jgi:hypothetical protein
MGKIRYQNCFLYVPTTSIKKKHLILGCNRILMPKSNRCCPKIHEGSSASTQYTTKRLFFKLGSWHISQATRGERERETHTHTHIDNIWQHNAMTLQFTPQLMKIFQLQLLFAARGQRTTFFLVILLVVVCCQLDPFKDGNEISPRRSALCFNLAANLSFHILASCTY